MAVYGTCLDFLQQKFLPNRFMKLGPECETLETWNIVKKKMMWMSVSWFVVAASQRMWALQRLRKLISTEFHHSLNVEAILGLEVSDESATTYNVRSSSLFIPSQSPSYNLSRPNLSRRKNSYSHLIFFLFAFIVLNIFFFLYTHSCFKSVILKLQFGLSAAYSLMFLNNPWSINHIQKLQFCFNPHKIYSSVNILFKLFMLDACRKLFVIYWTKIITYGQPVH